MKTQVSLMDSSTLPFPSTAGPGLCWTAFLSYNTSAKTLWGTPSTCHLPDWNKTGLRPYCLPGLPPLPREPCRAPSLPILPPRAPSTAHTPTSVSQQKLYLDLAALSLWTTQHRYFGPAKVTWSLLPRGPGPSLPVPTAGSRHRLVARAA